MSISSCLCIIFIVAIAVVPETSHLCHHKQCFTVLHITYHYGFSKFLCSKAFSQKLAVQMLCLHKNCMATDTLYSSYIAELHYNIFEIFKYQAEPWGSHGPRQTQQNSALQFWFRQTMWLQPPSFSMVTWHFGHSCQKGEKLFVSFCFIMDCHTAI